MAEDAFHAEAALTGILWTPVWQLRKGVFSQLLCR
jgi:hypothetical protein